MEGGVHNGSCAIALTALPGSQVGGCNLRSNFLHVLGGEVEKSDQFPMYLRRK